MFHTNAGGPGFLPVGALTLAGTKRGRSFANGIVPQGLASLDWYGDSYPTFPDKTHFPLRWLDLNPAISAGNAQRHSGLQMSLIANRSRKHKPASGIHG
ncbi:MAG TPA: hypothetical protein VNN25_20900 [Thermoanaerobaculia bacterium]|nr:hypothetical protein [Thermoanaerobaculia bacterium]